MTRIHVEEAALVKLKNELGTTGETYKKNFDRMTALVKEIVSGHIKGDPADEFLKKYEAKKEAFQRVYDVISDTQDYMGGKTTRFVNDVNDLMKEMR